MWREAAAAGAVLTTTRGERVEVLYPGRMNDGRGADVCDAVVTVAGRLLKGDIEVHVRSSDWQAHRHHQDAAYDRVVLHVVMRDDGRTATCLSNGGAVPVVALDQCARAAEDVILPRTPCSGIGCAGSTTRLAEVIDDAGEARFLAKADEYRDDLARMAAGQSLYRGIMGALGYARNKEPFLELAERVPLDGLEEPARGCATEEERLAWLQSRLLGTAGLLPSQRRGSRRRDRLDDACVDRLERQWVSSGGGKVMPIEKWHLFRVRPNNSPIRRLVAMSHLIWRYRDSGLLRGLAASVSDSGDHCRLEEALTVAAQGRRAGRFDFGGGNRTGSPTLLGRRRAADIVVNVLLPFTFTWGSSTGRWDLTARALGIYHRYPRLGGNALERHMMAQLGVANGFIDCARRQQALIHIYQTRCTQGRCPGCRLAHA